MLRQNISASRCSRRRFGDLLLVWMSSLTQYVHSWQEDQMQWFFLLSFCAFCHSSSGRNEVSIALQPRLLLPVRARKWEMEYGEICRPQFQPHFHFAATPNFDRILPSISALFEWFSAPTVFGGLSIGSADLIWPIYHICLSPGPRQIEKRGISEFLLN